MDRQLKWYPTPLDEIRFIQLKSFDVISVLTYFISLINDTECTWLLLLQHKICILFTSLLRLSDRDSDNDNCSTTMCTYKYILFLWIQFMANSYFMSIGRCHSNLSIVYISCSGHIWFPKQEILFYCVLVPYYDEWMKRKKLLTRFKWKYSQNFNLDQCFM